MKLTFDGKPISKNRPRFCRRGFVYDSQKTDSTLAKKETATQALRHGLEGPLEGAISVDLRYYIQMPKSWSKKKKKLNCGTPCTSRPDVDNLMKWTFDILNQIAFYDDKQISCGHFQKTWDYKGRTEVEVNKNGTNFKEYFEKISVDMHESLQKIYKFSVDLKKDFPQNKKIYSITNLLQEICLEGGLHEIYAKKQD